MPIQPDLFTCNRCKTSDLRDNEVERFLLTNAALDEPGLYYEEAYLCLNPNEANDQMSGGCRAIFEEAKAEFSFESLDEDDLTE